MESRLGTAHPNMLTRRIKLLDGDVRMKKLAAVFFVINFICLPSSFAEIEPPPIGFFLLIQNLATGNDAQDIANIKEVSKHPFEESSLALINRLLLEASRTQSSGNINVKLYQVLLKAIGKHTTNFYLANLQSFSKELDQISAGIEDQEVHDQKIKPIAEMLIEVTAHVVLREKPLPKAIDLMAQKQGIILPNAAHIINPLHETHAVLGPDGTELPHTPAKPTADTPQAAVPLSTIIPTESKVVPEESQSVETATVDNVPTQDVEVQPSEPAQEEAFVDAVSKFIALPTPAETQNLGIAVEESIPARKKDFREAVSHLDFVRTYMERYVVGQPEAVKSFVDLERESLFMGRQGKRLLMSLPGAGKDTLAITFVNAINDGDPKAFETHMLRIPVMNSRWDLGKIQGAATGVMGSNHLSSLIEFLVNHSGGRYLIEKIQEGYSITSRVIQNPAWKGQDLKGYFSADQALLYVDNLHLWYRDGKDQVFLDALKEGRFKIANSAGGEQEIVVPVKMAFATAEGTSLLAARELNGQRYGEPQTIEQLVNNWELVHNDHERLKNEARRSNGAVNAGASNESKGTSEQLLSLFGEGEILLLRPLTEANIKEIVKQKLEALAKKLVNPESLLGQVKLTWSEEMVHFLATFHYFAEENANPLDVRISNMVQHTLLDGIEKKKLEGSKHPQHWHLHVMRNSDKTYSLVIKVERENNTQQITLPILATLSERSRKPITDEEIDHILSKEVWMSSRVFGVDHIIKRVMVNYLVSEEARNVKVEWHEATAMAQTYMLLGLSSTGKTEFSKVLSEAQFGKRTAIKTISFNGIKTFDQVKAMFFGKKDEHGNPIPTDFMKEYDRNNGRVLFVFDETSETPMSVLTELYDIFREPVVTLFCDNKPRPMGGVTIVATGNAGAEWMTNVPRDIPSDQQLAAMQMMYDQAMSDPDARRELLEKYFPSALINRIGEGNIFFFGPLTFQSIRSLTQLKLGSALERLKPADAKRGWHLQFTTKEEYLKLVEMIEDIGFILHEQGASIDRFVKQDIEQLFHFHLLKEKIPTNANVTIKVTKLDDIVKPTTTRASYRVDLITGSKTVTIMYEGRDIKNELAVPVEQRFLTNVHEAAHELAREVLFGNKILPIKIASIPGVVKMQGKWLYYAGIATSVDVTAVRVTRQQIIYDMAVFFAGEVAETLITQNISHAAGKASDMEQATELARIAVLRFGLSEKFGRMTIPKEAKMEDQIHLLSPERRDLFDAEVNKMLREARDLAKTIISQNLDAVIIPMGQELLKKGVMEGPEILEFYKTHKVNYTTRPSMLKRMSLNFKDRLAKWRQAPDSLDVQLISKATIPDEVADIKDITKELKRKAVLDVPVPDNIPLQASECEIMLNALRVMGEAL